MSDPRVRLCPLALPHLERTLAWANDPELMILLNRAQPVTAEEHAAWFARVTVNNQCAYFAIETIDDRHIGNVWLWNIDARHRRAEVRIVIGDAVATDRGYGSAALDSIARFAFDSLELHKVYAYVLAINPRARRAFEKAGFTTEGLLRADRWSGDRWVDVHLLGRLCDDRSAAAND
ncbi:MAG TPA: GNAT family protein [Vicinamibacterales bacterium]|nr:GNAT family protein [Vicinamibacterales bacterium]